MHDATGRMRRRRAGRRQVMAGVGGPRSGRGSCRAAVAGAPDPARVLLGELAHAWSMDGTGASNGRAEPYRVLGGTSHDEKVDPVGSSPDLRNPVPAPPGDPS